MPDCKPPQMKALAQSGVKHSSWARSILLANLACAGVAVQVLLQAASQRCNGASGAAAPYLDSHRAQAHDKKIRMCKKPKRRFWPVKPKQFVALPLTALRLVCLRDMPTLALSSGQTNFRALLKYSRFGTCRFPLSLSLLHLNLSSTDRAL